MSIIIILLIVFLAVGVVYIVFLKIFIRSSKHIQVLNADEFEKRLAATRDAQIIDVRTPREYRKYRIVGAKNIDYLNNDFHREIKKLDKTKPVMIHCHSGYRSKMALPNFCKAGFRTIYELDSGFSGWLKAGKPIEPTKSRNDDSLLGSQKSRSDNTLLTVDAIYGQDKAHCSQKSRSDDTFSSTTKTQTP